MSASESSHDRDQFTIQIRCKCGQNGNAVWEENSNMSEKGPETILVSLSDGFYNRIRKKDAEQLNSSATNAAQFNCDNVYLLI